MDTSVDLPLACSCSVCGGDDEWEVGGFSASWLSLSSWSEGFREARRRGMMCFNYYVDNEYLVGRGFKYPVQSRLGIR